MTGEQRTQIIQAVSDTLIKAMKLNLHVVQIVYVNPFGGLETRTVYADEMFEVRLIAAEWQNTYDQLGFEYGLYIDGAHESSHVK